MCVKFPTKTPIKNKQRNQIDKHEKDDDVERNRAYDKRIHAHYDIEENLYK